MVKAFAQIFIHGKSWISRLKPNLIASLQTHAMPIDLAEGAGFEPAVGY
jgi:hypothetical protein